MTPFRPGNVRVTIPRESVISQRRRRACGALFALFAAAVLASVLDPGLPARAEPAVVTVGTAGNEPLVTRAPDGTLYISALQHLYRSEDDGASWSTVQTPIYASTLNVASDSSISVDPGGRLYFSFDWPYAGPTAACTSDDHGATWSCNPNVGPGGTDRMWVTAPSNRAAYLVTNEGAYKSTLFTSSDRGATWVPGATNTVGAEPQTGALLQEPGGSTVVQPLNAFDSGSLSIIRWQPGSPLADVTPLGLPLANSLPSAAFTSDGVLYAASETTNSCGGRAEQVVRGTLSGGFTTLPQIAGTTTGTSTFSAVAAGAPGDVGVLFYSTDTCGDPRSLTDASWSARWARSTNADSASPSWTVTTLETGVHVGGICAAVGCPGNARFSGDNISALIDSTNTARLTWMNDAGQIRFANGPLGMAGSPLPTASPSPDPTASPSPDPTASPSPSPSASPTDSPTPSASPSLSPTPTPAPTDSPTPLVTPSPSPTPTPTPTTPGPVLSPTPSASPSPIPPQLVITSGPSLVTYGVPTRVVGRLTTNDGKTALNGRHVSLQVRRKGSTQAFAVVADVNTDASGFATFTSYRPTVAFDYRLLYGATTSSQKSASIQRNITATWSASSVRVSQTTKLTGKVSPGSNGTIIYLQRKSGSSWANVASQRISSSSAYGFSVRPTNTGTYYYRVYVKAADGFVTSVRNAAALKSR